MKIYIAGFFNTRARLWEYRDALIKQGHNVVSSWLNEKPKPEHMNEADFFKHTAIKDLAEVLSSDCILVDTFDVSPRGGREFESGYAWADPNRLFYTVGPRRNIFHHLADQTWGTWPQVIDYFARFHSVVKIPLIEEVNGKSREIL